MEPQIIDGQSERLGEIPTTIKFTPEWPYGRYTYPAGGMFIREYEESAPLPEALTEIQQSQRKVIIEPVVVPQSAAVPAFTAIGGKAYSYFEVPEKIETAIAERGPSPPYERAYLAGLGKPTERYRVTTATLSEEQPPQQSLWEKYKRYIIAAGVVGVVGIVIVASR